MCGNVEGQTAGASPWGHEKGVDSSKTIDQVACCIEGLRREGREDVGSFMRIVIGAERARWSGGE